MLEICGSRWNGRPRTAVRSMWPLPTGLPGPADPGFDPAAHLEALDRMAAMGMTWTSTSVPGTSAAEAIEALERYGTEVIAAGR